MTTATNRRDPTYLLERTDAFRIWVNDGRTERIVIGTLKTFICTEGGGFVSASVKDAAGGEHLAGSTLRQMSDQPAVRVDVIRRVRRQLERTFYSKKVVRLQEAKI